VLDSQTVVGPAVGGLDLALFGRPIAEGLVAVRCINRVMLNKVDYKLNFGPLLTDAFKSDKAVASSSSRGPDQ